MPKLLSSFQNPIIKKVIQLQEKSRARRKEGLFVIEGKREIALARAGNYSIETVLFLEEVISEDEIRTIAGNTEVIEVTNEIYQKIAYRGGTEGVIAFAKAKPHKLTSLSLPKNPLLLIAEAPEKPGNIGALLRTADAAGVDAFILANPKTDLYNPNIIRSSVGCVFTNQIATASTEEIIGFLKEKEIAIYSAILQEAQLYMDQDFSKSSAIVVGTEAIGLSKAWREASLANIKIPMMGTIDSMNVSVAAGILIFEARRQRGL